MYAMLTTQCDYNQNTNMFRDLHYKTDKET